ncbi:MAG: cation:proton antiporter [Nanoarchaeota archaeon]
MADVLVFLTSLTLVLLAGIISVSISRKFKIPLPLTLLVSGVILGNIFYNERPIIDLGGMFLAVLSVVALVVVLFDSTRKIKIHEYDVSVKDSLRFFVFALILNLIILSFAAKSFFNLQGFSSVIFALLISCVEYLAIFPRHHLPTNRVTHFVRNEATLSCAVILLIPFLILSLGEALNSKLDLTVFGKVIFVATNLFAGIGAGVIIGLILFSLLSKNYFEHTAALILGIGLLLSFIIAQRIGGNGYAAVATIGFIFGNIFVKPKQMIVKQENMIYSALEVLMFIIVGVVVSLPRSLRFFEFSFGLFLIYLVIRFAVSRIALRKYDSAEKWEIAFFVPKGLATVTVAFALLNFSFTGVVVLVQLLLMFFVYSLVFDTILSKLGFYKHR